MLNDATKIDVSTLMPYLCQYGHYCMAYSTLQDGLQYYIEEGVGYIAYINYRNPLFLTGQRCIVLSDPIVAQANYEGIIQRFLAIHKHVTFVQVHEPVAEILSSMGYQVNQIGIESSLNLQSFSLRGKARSQLRQWYNKCEREKVIVEEVSFSEGLSEVAQQLTDEWLSKKGGRENRFLTRPMRYYDECDVRYFRASQAGRILAYAVFDPMYDEGSVVAYYHNIDRMASDAPNGTGVYLLLKALDTFQQEGKASLSLGMSPLYRLKEGYQHNVFTSKSFKYTYNKLNSIYPFKGNARHKKKFAAEQSRVYFSSTKGNHLGEAFIMFHALGFI